MTMLLFSVKVKMFSLLIHRTNPRHDTLYNRKNQNIVLFAKGFQNRCFGQSVNEALFAVL